MESIKDLKELVLKDNIAQKGKTYESVIKKNFPEIYDSIKGEWYKENLYCLLYDTKIPNCPVCGKPLRLRNFVKGFIHSCKECSYILQKQDVERSKRISDHHIAQNIRSNNLKKKYPDLDIEPFYEVSGKIGRKYPRWRVKNYCKHGDVIFKDQKILDKLYNSHKCLCQECKRELAEHYVPSDEEIIKAKEKLKELRLKYIQAFSDEWFVMYYPEILGVINYNSIDKSLGLIQKVWLFEHGFKEIPICEHEGCHEKVKWNNSGTRYLKRCERHINLCFQSESEKEVKKFLDNLGVKYLSNIRRIVSRELDAYIEDKKIGIEYNGVFWHNIEAVEDTQFHYKKWKECREKGIQMLTIWKDDWHDDKKKEILKSIIKSKIGISKRIYARNCNIAKLVSTREFLNENHLQGWCQSSYNYALEYDGDIVALMTFGKSRFKKDEIELLRYCCKKDVNVIGGASRLFKHFIEDYNPDKVISYANCEISNGNMYEVLGFNEIGKSIDYWWAKNGKRESRYKFMKSKLIEKFPEKSNMSENEIMKSLGYYKVYGVGNLKYEWTNKN